MRFFKANIYWKANPDVEHTRYFCMLDDYEDSLERAEALEIDNNIFYYLQDPEELEDLQQYDNGEEFVVCPRSAEEVPQTELY